MVKTTDIYEPEYVRKLFNHMSRSYERMNLITSFGFSFLWRKQFIKKLKDSDKPLKVIDLLSRLGENWPLLVKRYPNAQFYALDFSDEMVKRSQHKNLVQTGNRFNILQQNLLENERKSGEYTVVTSAFGLKTFNEVQIDFLDKTTYSILAADGAFSFIEISTPDNKMLYSLYKFYLGK